MDSERGEITSVNKQGLFQLSHHQVSVKLNDENFLVWKQQVLIVVKGHGLDGFLDGTISQPPRFISSGEEGILVPNPEHMLWQRQDQLLASWILSTLSESILISVVGFNTSFEIWQNLEGSFSSLSTARKMQYKIQLQNLKKGALSMREYLNKMKGLCDALASTGERMKEEDQILYVLSGLGNEYDDVVVTVTAKGEGYGMKELTSLLLSYENFVGICPSILRVQSIKS